MFPTGRIIPAAAFQFYVFEVPMTDEMTATYLVFHGPEPQDRDVIIDTMGLADPRFWTYEGCDFRASWDDRLGQDRDSMDRNWSGFAGIEQEDSVIAMSMQPIVDRTQEYLVPSDEAVIRLRRRLLDSVALNDAGKDPLGLQVPTIRKSLPFLTRSYRNWAAGRTWPLEIRVPEQKRKSRRQSSRRLHTAAVIQTRV